MAEPNLIALMLEHLYAEQPIHTALCIGQNLSQYDHNQSIQWHYFNVTEFLNLPFQQRYDLGFIWLHHNEFLQISPMQKAQLLVKLRDLMAKRIVVAAQLDDEKLLRSLGFTRLLEHSQQAADFEFWQFNILTYKQVPDWLNARFWANPENWNKFRW